MTASQSEATAGDALPADHAYAIARGANVYPRAAGFDSRPASADNVHLCISKIHTPTKQDVRLCFTPISIFNQLAARESSGAIQAPLRKGRRRGHHHNPRFQPVPQLARHRIPEMLTCSGCLPRNKTYWLYLVAMSKMSKTK